MFRSRIVALTGTIAAAAACTVFATSAASAAPAPTVSPTPACGTCWGPIPHVVKANAPEIARAIVASVGSGARGLEF